MLASLAASTARMLAWWHYNTGLSTDPSPSTQPIFVQIESAVNTAVNLRAQGGNVTQQVGRTGCDAMSARIGIIGEGCTLVSILALHPTCQTQLDVVQLALTWLALTCGLPLTMSGISASWR
jgi:hypothetical protein